MSAASLSPRDGPPFGPRDAAEEDLIRDARRGLDLYEAGADVDRVSLASGLQKLANALRRRDR